MEENKINEEYIRAQFAAIECARDVLGLSEHEVNVMVGQVLGCVGLYVTKKGRPTKEEKEEADKLGELAHARHLLRKFNSTMSSHRFHKEMVKRGMCEKCLRGGSFYYKVIGEGLNYGCNKCTKENTNGLSVWYENKFQDLLNLIGA